MAYKLTDEQRAAREGVTFTAGEGFDFGSSHFLENWRRSDKELDYAEIYVLVHGAFKFREIFRHRLPMVVDLEEREREGKEPLPARRMLTSRQFTCQETLKWSKHLVIRKAMMSEPTCPIERLIEHVKGNPKLIDEVLFRFGDDCQTREYKPESPIELTGYDLMNKAKNWRDDHNFLAKGQHAALVVPLGGVKGTSKWATSAEDMAAKIMVGSWGLFGKLEAEINDAIEQHGEDVADPRWAPAVYRLIFDQRPRGGKKPQPSDQYSVKFAHNYPVAEAALDIGGNPIATDVASELKKLQTPSATREIFDALQTGLVYDIDLAKIMGVDEAPDSSDGGDDEPKPEPRKVAKPAAKKNGKASAKKSGRRVAKKEPEPEAAPAVSAEPCSECGTPWPSDRKYCPGRRDPEKNCTAYDLDIDDPTETDAPPAADESTELAFAE